MNTYLLFTLQSHNIELVMSKSFVSDKPFLNEYMTPFRIRCIGQSDCCQKRPLTQALNCCLTSETIVSCRIWQILNPSKCHITNSRMVLMEESFLTCKKIRLLQLCDSGRNMKWRCPQINDVRNKLYLFY